MCSAPVWLRGTSGLFCVADWWEFVHMEKRNQLRWFFEYTDCGLMLCSEFKLFLRFSQAQNQLWGSERFLLQRNDMIDSGNEFPNFT